MGKFLHYFLIFPLQKINASLTCKNIDFDYDGYDLEIMDEVPYNLSDLPSIWRRGSGVLLSVAMSKIKTRNERKLT